MEEQAGPVLLEDPSHLVDTSLGTQPLSSPSRSSPHSQGSEGGERFSRKVFVGGLPPDIDEDEITVSFRRFGPLVVDWPHKAESKSYFPPKGYAFLLFQVSVEGSGKKFFDCAKFFKNILHSNLFSFSKVFLILFDMFPKRLFSI